MSGNIFDCNSDEFDKTFDLALKEVAESRCNPNNSLDATYLGYCNAVERVGVGLAEAAKDSLKRWGF
jgi:hypothetical protein